MTALGQFGERARAQVPDLRDAIEAEQPDVVILDETSWGAAAAAEKSGLPWAFSVPSPVPIPSRDAPPFGFGLKPRQGRISISRALVRTALLCRMSCVCAVHVSAGRPPGMPSGDGSRPDAATTSALRLVRIRSNAVTEPP